VEGDGGVSMIVYLNDEVLRSVITKLPFSSMFEAPEIVTFCPSVSAGTGAAERFTVTTLLVRVIDETVDDAPVMPNDAAVMLALSVAKLNPDRLSLAAQVPLHVYRLRGVCGFVV
jgi:hypothetical protein